MPPEETESMEQTRSLALPEDQMPPIGVKQIDVEFQKHILDVSSLKLSMYCMWCGWRIREQPVQVKLPGGKVKTKLTRRIDINYNSRFINEDGVDLICDTFQPLIFQATQTSNLTEKQIYNLYNEIDTILWDLTCSYHMKVKMYDKSGKAFYVRNPYELVIEKLSTMGAFMQSFEAITSKAKGGHAVEHLLDSIISQHTVTTTGMMGYPPPKQNRSWIERFAGIGNK